jgi:hypothetical protein
MEIFWTIQALTMKIINLQQYKTSRIVAASTISFGDVTPTDCQDSFQN